MEEELDVWSLLAPPPPRGGSASASDSESSDLDAEEGDPFGAWPEARAEWLVARGEATRLHGSAEFLVEAACDASARAIALRAHEATAREAWTAAVHAAQEQPSAATAAAAAAAAREYGALAATADDAETAANEAELVAEEAGRRSEEARRVAAALAWRLEALAALR